MIRVLRQLFSAVSVLLYPYLVYRAMQAGWVWIGPVLVAGLLVVQGFRATTLNRRWIKWLLALGLCLGAAFFQAMTAKLLPAFIQLALLHFFAKTLTKGPPLVERFVRLEFPDPPLEIVRYARQLTQVWSVFFAFNALVCAGLAIWGPTAWWALYSGVILFALTAFLMMGEYAYRHYRFPNLLIPDVRSTVRLMVVNSRQIWLDVQAS